MESLQEMKQVSVSELLKEHSLVVPEIQREYVWGKNEYDILDTFIEDIINGYTSICEEESTPNALQDLLEKATPEQRAAIQSLIDNSNSEKQISSFMNIGFLYSYKPNYYISDEGKDAYLIDGQQRFTTLFLILFYLAIKENRVDKFKLLYRVNEAESKIAFDYRVRALTHNFIIDLISNTKTIDDLLGIRHKSWFLSNYNKDTTINAIVGDENTKGAFETIHKHLKTETINYFDFVSSNVKFWHFKTEETSQGEELYITMNSRGQQLADNETIRAILFKSEIAKKAPLKWSQLWEEWQDLFWKNRKENSNSADKGFNEFLACIAGLENLLTKTGKIYKKEDFDKFKQISSKDIIKQLDLHKIKKYINCLKMIVNEELAFKNQYINYSEWTNKCGKLVWNLFNVESTNWFADPKDTSRGTEHSRMVFLWSILLYSKNNVRINRDEFFRALRLSYVRYNNYDRSVFSISPLIDNIVSRGFLNSDMLSDEEKSINSIINSNIDNDEIVRKFEELIWEIEDHKFNLNGRDVGSVNISHLINLNEDISIKELENVKNKFYEIFPLKEENYKELQSVLLYYSSYWYQVSPYYYTNMEFSDWRYIIRGISTGKVGEFTAFSNFVKDFLKYKGSLSDFLNKKREKDIDWTKADSFRKKILWYNQYLKETMWSQGNNIAFSNGQECSLPDWKNKDKVFDDHYILYNTKGNLKGGNPQKLYDLLPNEVKKQIKEVKKQ